MMLARGTLSAKIVAVLALGCGSPAAAQTLSGPEPVRLIQPGQVPRSAQKYLAAAGDRITRPGRERATVVATLQVRSGSAEAINWVAEFPGKLRMQRGAGRTVLLNPQRGNVGDVNDLDEEIAETLTADTAEQFFHRLECGIAPRFLGMGFKRDGVTGFCSTVDIFELATPVAARAKAGTSVKHFMFDSATHLLCRVMYGKHVRGSWTTAVTEFSQYEAAEGQPSAKRIVRRNGTETVFTIDLTNIQWTPARADGLFQ